MPIAFAMMDEKIWHQLLPMDPEWLVNTGCANGGIPAAKLRGRWTSPRVAGAPVTQVFPGSWKASARLADLSVGPSWDPSARPSRMSWERSISASWHSGQTFCAKSQRERYVYQA